MSDWAELGSPADLLAIRPTPWGWPPSATYDVATTTWGGELWVRRRAADGTWTWQNRGRPPGSASMLGLVAVLGGDGAMVAVGDSSSADIWVSRQVGATAVWDTVHGPANSAGMLVPIPTLDPDAPQERLFLVVADGVPWLGAVTGVVKATGKLATAIDPIHDGVDDWQAVGHATMAAATVTPGESPVPHAITGASDQVTGEFGVRIGFPGAAGWTWVDPGKPPGGTVADVWDAVGVGTAAGGMEVCALFFPVSTDDPPTMLRGAGSSWRWEDLGRPAGVMAPVPRGVAATTGADGTQRPCAVVLGDALDQVFRTHGDNVWEPVAGIAVNGNIVEGGVIAAPTADALRLAGSDGIRLWTLEPGAAAAEVHTPPRTLVHVVGVMRPTGIVVLDDAGVLWHHDTQVLWAPLPDPAPGVTVRAAVGQSHAGPTPSIFVIGTDEHLWELTLPGDGTAQWVDHDTPTPGRIKYVAAPVGFPGATGADIAIIGNDGRLWVRRVQPNGASWEDRGTPPGKFIFGIAAALAPAAVTVVVVVTGDGHLWAHEPGSSWTHLGDPPAAAGQVAASLGGIVVVGAGGGIAFELGVVDARSRQVWTVLWQKPAVTWTLRGLPPGVNVRGTVGMTFGPSGGPQRYIVVAGDDDQIWLFRSGGGAGDGWVPWGQPTPRDRAPIGVTNGSVLDLPGAGGFQVASAGDDGRLWTAGPPG